MVELILFQVISTFIAILIIIFVGIEIWNKRK